MPNRSIRSTVTGVNPAVPLSEEAANRSLRVAILYRRNAYPDEQVLQLLETRLVENGHSLFIDRRLLLGVEWAKEIERQVRTADAVIPLISQESIQSEMLIYEIENAHEAAQMQHGQPRLLPIRIQFSGHLPEPLAGILDPIQYLLWESPKDDPGLISELLRALRSLRSLPEIQPWQAKNLGRLPRSSPKPAAVGPALQWAGSSGLPPLEPVGGAVPLNSAFYIVRPADSELRSALARHDTIILIKGARQMGKTSMLARGLQFARERAAKVALTDFQKFNAANLETLSHFYLSLAESLADQLDLSVTLSEVWDERRGPNINFERFLRRDVLSQLNVPLVWGLDEVDRLFVCSYGSEVFGLFRSWHNERALDPAGPWARMTLAIAYATEAHLFITDMNQSPFNVGTRLSLEDFTEEQAAELNRRHGDPLKNPDELRRFIGLVGGHPYLVRRGLHELAAQKMEFARLEAEADRDEGVFGDHLRRILMLLAKDPALMDVVREILRGKPCPTVESFYRLRSAGVMVGNLQTDVRPRCRLYAHYLTRHLLES